MHCIRRENFWVFRIPLRAATADTNACSTTDSGKEATIGDCKLSRLRAADCLLLPGISRTLPKNWSSKLHACYNRTQKPKLNKMLKKNCAKWPAPSPSTHVSNPIQSESKIAFLFLRSRGMVFQPWKSKTDFTIRLPLKNKVTALAKTENRVMLVVSSVWSTVTCELGWKDKETEFLLASF